MNSQVNIIGFDVAKCAAQLLYGPVLVRNYIVISLSKRAKLKILIAVCRFNIKKKNCFTKSKQNPSNEVDGPRIIFRSNMELRPGFETI